MRPFCNLTLRATATASSTRPAASFLLSHPFNTIADSHKYEKWNITLDQGITFNQLSHPGSTCDLAPRSPTGAIAFLHNL